MVFDVSWQDTVVEPPDFPGECPFHRGQSIWDCACRPNDEFDDGDEACWDCDGEGTVHGGLCARCRGSGRQFNTWEHR